MTCGKHCLLIITLSDDQFKVFLHKNISFVYLVSQDTIGEVIRQTGMSLCSLCCGRI